MMLIKSIVALYSFFLLLILFMNVSSIKNALIQTFKLGLREVVNFFSGRIEQRFLLLD